MDSDETASASRRHVAEAIDRIEAAFGPFTVVDERRPVDDGMYADYVDRVARGTVGGAGTWVVDEAGRVLFVRKRGEAAWCEPGGHHEPGETLAETARRETREETGLRVALRDVRFAQRTHVVPDGTTDPDAIHRLLVVFTATPIGGRLRPRPSEIAAVDWFETHPEPLLYEELRRLSVPVTDS